MNFICLVGLVMAISIVLLWGTSFIILMGWTKSMNASGKKEDNLMSDMVNNNEYSNSGKVGANKRVLKSL